MGNGPWSISNENGEEIISLTETSWNRFANLIFLESPVEVGFSFSTNKAEDFKNLNDNQYATDVYDFLLNFLKNDKFSKYSKNELWITG